MDLPDKTSPSVSKKEIKAVVSGATLVQRPATKRFFDFLFQESPKELGKKIGRDIVVPRLKASFQEAAEGFLSGMLWGQGGKPLNTIVQGTVLRGGGVAYNHISNQQNAMSMARQATVGQSLGNYQDVVVGTQQAAEALLANLYALLNQYRVVAVADLYEAAGLTPAISDNNYGWTNLDGARISKIREGFVLELPRPVLI